MKIFDKLFKKVKEDETVCFRASEFCIKSYIKGHKIHHLGSVANLASRISHKGYLEPLKDTP